MGENRVFVLVLIIAVAMMLLVQSHHFVMFFVALETVTIAFYVWFAYCRTRVLFRGGPKVFGDGRSQFFNFAFWHRFALWGRGQSSSRRF